jgi:hypothetical protein
MALTTYAELQTAVGDWLARSDLTGNIPDFITLFEATACRKLRVRPTETSTTLTPSSGAATLPSDFLGVRRLTYEGSSAVDLTYVHPSYLQQAYPTAEDGVPAVYTIEGGTVRIRPVSTENLTLVYRAKTAAVSGTLNWLFTNHPDAYLFGALTEAYMFLRDPENAAVWKARTEKAMDEIKEVDFHYRGPMEMRIWGPTP